MDADAMGTGSKAAYIFHIRVRLIHIKSAKLNLAWKLAEFVEEDLIDFVNVDGWGLVVQVLEDLQVLRRKDMVHSGNTGC